MKITINYDLMDKIAEANKGYSLKRCFKRTLGFASITSIIGIADNIVRNCVFPDFLGEIVLYIGFHATHTGMYAWALNNITKQIAETKLADLIQELSKLNIKTNEEAILESYAYKTTYRIDQDSSLPQIKQQKYINIPIRDEYWGDKEMSLLQEHTIGSSEYVLSIGEPEEKKVYYLNLKTMKGR